MLDTTTKRRIDNARDILVGKVPDPKSQVEQITIALIYKFMDDMDAEAEDLGGKRKFFTGDFAQYGWSKLMSAGIGGHELIGLYSEGIATMPQNTGIPPLFRDIFKNAYLPYRDPETLKSFLKIIDEFSYDHSERLGDAYEYLLSVLGSQGDAGQFRTPRHIIDFMVDILNPQKHETMGDTACGTAGFLISAYKHVLKHNSSDYQPEPNTVKAANDVPLELLTVDSPLHYKGDLLTPDERKRLAENIKGYDISPDMVRMSLVNLYLHGFNDPHIVEYDTLTSEARWDEYFDVIFANPPFMSPKGGIKPHKRFSIQAKRSEVLFVDYIAEHLTPTGRAGIIVPEGIIFQSQTAYKALRKMLVDTALVAVISLPAGVFQPYSGVKTSILILDKTLAKHSDRVAFFKIENDGFGLGAQRRAVAGEQLSQVKRELAEFLQAIGSEEAGEFGKPELGLIVKKERIAENGDYNLSGERYRESEVSISRFSSVQLGEIILGTPQYGSGASKIPFDGEVRYVRITDLTNDGMLKRESVVSPSIIEHDCFLEFNDLLIARSGSVGRTYLHREHYGTYQYAGYLIRFRIDPTKALPEFIFHVTKSELWNKWVYSNSKTGTLTNINAKQYSTFAFPLPSIDVQKEIVVEIEGYQKVINGARAVLDNYRPHISIQPDWPMVKLCDVTESISDGDHMPPPKSESGVPFVTITNIDEQNKINFTKTFFVSEEYYGTLKTQRKPQKGDILYTVTGSYGIPVLIESDIRFCFQRHIGLIRPSSKINTRYLYNLFSSSFMIKQADDAATGVAQKTVSLSSLRNFLVPLPELEIQEQIVAEIEAEKALVAANRELITRFEKKIQATLARVWGEEPEQENSL